MLQANGIYAKILLKLNFTCQDDIFMLQRYLYEFLWIWKYWTKNWNHRKRLSNDLKKIFKNTGCVCGKPRARRHWLTVLPTLAWRKTACQCGLPAFFYQHPTGIGFCVRKWKLHVAIIAFLPNQLYSLNVGWGRGKSCAPFCQERNMRICIKEKLCLFWKFCLLKCWYSRAVHQTLGISPSLGGSR
jgi:hypothetical protein